MTTTVIPGTDVAERITAAFPGAVIEATHHSVTVRSEQVGEIARFLRDDDELDCKFLNCLTAIDWMEHFDVIYVLSSLAKNSTLILEARIYAHEDPVVPSVTGVWQGANLQERELYDLMGIAFQGHPALKRIFLWDGFPGHPLRKDFLAMPAGHKPGLQRFPFEFPAGQRAYPSLSNEKGPRAPRVPELVQPLRGQAGAQPLSGGQLGVRGGGVIHTRAPGGLEPARPSNIGGAGNPDMDRTATGGRTPPPNEAGETEPSGGSGTTSAPEDTTDTTDTNNGEEQQ